MKFLRHINEEIREELMMEYMRSEKRRVVIILCMLAFSFMVVPIIHFLFPELIDNAMNRPEGLRTLLYGFLGFSLFEVLVLFRIRYMLKHRLMPPINIKYVNTCIEFSLSIFLLYYAVKYDHSLLLLEYDGYGFLIILIVLSTLHLDLKVSLLGGLIAGAGYGAVAFNAIEFLDIKDGVAHLNEIYGARALGLLVFGLMTGLVAREFDKKLRHSITFQQERKQVELLFGQQVSKEIADELLNTLDASSTKESSAAIMFLDIKDFSKWADRKTPQQVIEYQNKVFSPIIEIINNHNGIINQILGDGFMASFGVPKDDTGYVDNAFNAGLEIRAKIKMMELSGEIPQTYIRIGLHRGKIVIGNIGNDIRRQFSLAGRNIIIAARLEQLNKELETHFLISQEVKEHLEQAKTELTDMGAFYLKGIDQQIEVFKVEC
ncbi:hypothetical protein EYV94_15450 [Puteibacter caeruleilacunae]|nr:hypothetical protein EYV94_15450 [Puteibacter caeruleilacunae]